MLEATLSWTIISKEPLLYNVNGRWCHSWKSMEILSLKMCEEYGKWSPEDRWW